MVFRNRLRHPDIWVYNDTQTIPFTNMKYSKLIVSFCLVAGSNAGLLRFGCTQLTVQRLDPLVNPGANPSPHLHQIIGGVGVQQ